MDRKHVTIIIIVFMINVGYGQKFVLDLNWQPAHDSLPSGTTFFQAKDILGSDTLLRLKNEGWVKKYSTFKIAVTNPVKKSKYDSLLLLVAYKNNRLLMACDNNRNGFFYDDSVYSKVLDSHIKTDKAFRNSLPSIKVDSLLLIDQNNVSHFVSLSIKFAPSSRIYHFLTDSTQIKGSEPLNLTLYHGGRYYTKLQVKGKEYQIYVVPNILTSQYYPVLYSKFSSSFFWICKYVPEENQAKQKGLFFGVLESLWKDNKDIMFDEFKMNIVDVNIKAKQLTAKIDTRDTAKKIYPVGAMQKQICYSLKTSKNTTLNFTKKTYTLIEFTGSWCKPCQVVLPKVKELYSKFFNNIQFIAVQAERDTALAQSYVSKANMPFETIYEQLGCTAPTCFQSIFEVSLFPSFILMDSKGNLILKVSGDMAVDKIESVINSLNSKK